MFPGYGQNPEERTRSGKKWKWFRIIKYLVMLVCLLLLGLTQILYTVDDDFTPVRSEQKSNSSSASKSSKGMRSDLSELHIDREVISETATPNEVVNDTATTSEMITDTATISSVTTPGPSPRKYTPHKTHYRIQNPKRTTVLMRHFYRQGPINRVVTYIRAACGVYPNHTCMTTSALTSRGTTAAGTTISGATIFVTTTNKPIPGEGSMKPVIRKLRNPADVGNPMVVDNPSYTLSPQIIPTNSTDKDETDDQKKTKLSDLLVLYPCCTTVLIILGMEMCGSLLRDPMTKVTSLFFIIFCINLSLTIFIVSLVAAVRSIQWIMITICVLSVFFIILEIVDAVHVTRS